MKVLRRRMMQAGIFDPRAVAMFFVARTVLAVGLAFGGVRSAADGDRTERRRCTGWP